jgi:hypothetical protein
MTKYLIATLIALGMFWGASVHALPVPTSSPLTALANGTSVEKAQYGYGYYRRGYSRYGNYGNYGRYRNYSYNRRGYGGYRYGYR